MDSTFNRKYVIQALFIVSGLILFFRLFHLQILSDEAFTSAQSNVLRKVYRFPARGVVFDRNMNILVENEPVYDLLVTPSEVKPFDTLALAKILKVEISYIRSQLKRARSHSNYQPSYFERQIPVEIYAGLQEIMYNIPGFSIQDRTVRRYPDSIAGQLFGYVKEVSPDDIEKSDGYYKSGDFIGKSGLEKSYETFLRGVKGVSNMIADSRNISQGSYADGKYDVNAVVGEKLISSLDIRIQKLGEELMKNKVGAIVALEPSTGEILAFVSSPGYDPNQLVGKDWGRNYMKLIANPYRPQLVRPIAGQYSPGSSFKPVDALVALQNGVILPTTTFNCPGYYMAGKHKVKCEHIDGTINMERGIARSCNTYFCNVFRCLMMRRGSKNQRQTYSEWHSQISKWGFGQKLGIDMPFEKKGIFYPAEYYDKIYNKRWGHTTIISQGIGQGEITSTPLQMANVMAAIANRGYWIKPRLIKRVGEKKVFASEDEIKNYVGVDRKYFEPVIYGMRDAVNSPWGTARESQIPSIVMCGKTGTVQNPHGKNHSVFIGFAPLNQPKIAIAVIVENAGYGGSYAAPISSFIVEKYLTNKISSRANGLTVKSLSETNLLPIKVRPTKAKLDTTKIIRKTPAI